MWIIVEGLDGSGKSTAINELKDELISQGKPVAITRGIGTGDIGSFLRTKIKYEEALTPEMTIMAFPLALLDCLQEVKKLLSEGYVVITDRFVGSYWAYANDSILVDEIYNFMLDQVHKDAGFFKNYLVYSLYIDSPVEMCMHRIAKRGDGKYFDKAPKEEFNRVYRRYLAWYSHINKGVIIIPNNGDILEFKTSMIDWLHKIQDK